MIYYFNDYFKLSLYAKRPTCYCLLRHIITSRSTVSLFIFNPPSLFTFHRLFYCILVFLSFAMFNHFTSYINLSITFYFLIYIKISRSFFTIIFNQSQHNPKTQRNHLINTCFTATSFKQFWEFLI